MSLVEDEFVNGIYKHKNVRIAKNVWVVCFLEVEISLDAYIVQKPCIVPPAHAHTHTHPQSVTG